MNQKIILYKITTYVHYLIALLLFLLIIFSFIFLTYLGVFFLLFFYLFNFYYLFEILFSDFNYQQKRWWIIILLILPGTGAYLYFIFAKISFRQLNLSKKLPIIKNGQDINDQFSLISSKIENLELDSNFFMIRDSIREIDNFIFDLKNAKKEICFFLSDLDYGIVWQKLKNELSLKVKEKNLSIYFIVDFFALNKNNQKIIKEIKLIKNCKIFYFNNWKIFDSLRIKKLRGNLNFIIIDNKITYFNGINLLEKKFLFAKDGFVFANGFKFKDNLTIFFNYLFNYFVSFFDLKLSEKLNHEILNSEKLKEIKINQNNQQENIQFFVNGLNRNNDFYYKNFIDSIKKAQKSINIIIPNLLILNDFKDCLIDALNKNIEVKCIISETNNKNLKSKLSRLYEEELITFGAKIFKLENIKTTENMLLIDNKYLLFSTSNSSYKSIFNNLNLNLVIRSEKTIKNVNAFFEDLLKNSYKETTNYLHWSIFKQLFYKFIAFIFPIL
ncbi:MAG: cardiolipin synthase [Candidatus Hepatoplasma scabrum]|nr:MAG: cardiolipin synthase [Candidatus Hepatoplasma sp.]